MRTRGFVSVNVKKPVQLNLFEMLQKHLGVTVSALLLSYFVESNYLLEFNIRISWLLVVESIFNQLHTLMIDWFIGV